jgi:hypothetical protein
VVGFKRLALTDLKLDIKRVPGKTELTKAFTEAGETAKQAEQQDGSSEAAPGQPSTRHSGNGSSEAGLG